MSWLTWPNFTEMILNGIIIGMFANLICPQTHKFVIWIWHFFK
jgi:hypothetical protein